MIKLIIFVLYLAYGYMCFKKGVDAYGGKNEYLTAQNVSEAQYYTIGLFIMLIWPILTIKAIITKIKENER